MSALSGHGRSCGGHRRAGGHFVGGQDLAAKQQRQRGIWSEVIVVIVGGPAIVSTDGSGSGCSSSSGGAEIMEKRGAAIASFVPAFIIACAVVRFVALLACFHVATMTSGRENQQF